MSDKIAKPHNSRLVYLTQQSEWKRTQLRLPQELYTLLNDYAENNRISLNTAIVIAVEGLVNTVSTEEHQANINAAQLKLANLSPDARNLVCQLIHRLV